MDKNEKAFRDGMAKANIMIAERLSMGLLSLGEWLLNDAEVSAEYHNLTGNTLTSLAFGMYDNFMLKEIILLDSGKPAIRRKLVKGEVISDFVDYDGNLRPYFKGEVDTDGGWGTSTSYRFLRDYKPPKPLSIVVTTGTEYSEFLEQELGLNVLTDTRDEARMRGKAMFLNGFKKIK